jgi:hypothetical protein
MFSAKLAGVVVAFSLTATSNLYATHCTVASLNGTYAYSGHGFTEVTPDVSSAGFAPFAQPGLVVYDGKGHILSGTFTYSTTTANAGSFRGTFTGTYAINADCSGSATAGLGDGTLVHFDLVARSPSAYTLINTDPGAFLSVYVAHRIGGDN